ncbi:hypothetical protein NONO_c17720 [Nocardia nova SH22a]|uniref:Uncharacterized protein n=1 Tax=Nocardia nova SH22a TaxID=1415166 RepID=W5TBI7_9NOCA|nr:hypothetical protein [Nocardia nova]AHH16572.1 hypothetical protein NONO_c17720 [Nocardia nova SH22a]
MTDNVDHLYLTRAQIGALADLLGEIPALIEELAITETRQARVRPPGLGGSTRSHPESRPPVHMGAFEAAEALRNELTTWIRAVCEQRAVRVPAVDDLGTAARWLKRHIYSLATTQGAETAHLDIETAIFDCRYEIDLPPEDEIRVDPVQLRAANNSIVTAYTVGAIAAKLGPIGKGLNRDRVRYLVKVGALKSVSRDGETAFYRLGDVLVAHASRKGNGAA